MQISKWGNSLGVRLPKAFVDELQLAAGDELELVLNNNKQFELRKIDRRKAFIEKMASFRIELPADYKFDREDANSR